MIAVAGSRKLPGVSIAWLHEGTKVGLEEAVVKGYCGLRCDLRGQRGEGGCALTRPDPK